MNPVIKIEDLGRLDYRTAWDMQKDLFNQILAEKENKNSTENTLLFVEHNHVYTLGKSGDRSNLLISDNQLNELKASFVQVDRGGDITYHGPEQLVVYPIFDLENFGIRTREFVFRLEEAVIKLLKSYNIIASRKKSAAGVWLDADNSKARKICSIGIKSSRSATMHGIALNVNTDLAYFGYINPCGFVDKTMTNMQHECDCDVDMQDAKERLLVQIAKVFSATIVTKGSIDKAFPSC